MLQNMVFSVEPFAVLGLSLVAARVFVFQVFDVLH